MILFLIKKKVIERKVWYKVECGTLLNLIRIYTFYTPCLFLYKNYTHRLNTNFKIFSCVSICFDLCPATSKMYILASNLVVLDTEYEFKDSKFVLCWEDIKVLKCVLQCFAVTNLTINWFCISESLKTGFSSQNSHSNLCVHVENYK